MAARKKKTKEHPPWERKNPRPGTKKLSASAKQRAKRRAKKAGRRYPNLVDNLREARKASPRRKPSSKRKSPKKARRKKVTKDPRGGLTAAGRAEFRRREGSHLRPGVKKKAIRDMTPTELRRKGSWAVRFYGRKQLPPLKDQNGEPTRFALSARAWGEPVPRTVTQARAIAKRGERLLERYERTKRDARPRARA